MVKQCAALPLTPQKAQTGLMMSLRDRHQGVRCPVGSPRVCAADRHVLGTSSSICADSQLGHHCVQQRCVPFVGEPTAFAHCRHRGRRGCRGELSCTARSAPLSFCCEASKFVCFAAQCRRCSRACPALQKSATGLVLGGAGCNQIDALFERLVVSEL